MPNSEPDDVLIGRAQADRLAFEPLYERYVAQIYAYAYYRIGNEQDAEDITARTFYQALTHLNRYTSRGVPFSAWLFRIAHNLVANWHRDESRRPTVPLDEHAASRVRGEHPEAEALAGEEQSMLLEVVRQLPEDRQQLLILKFVERLSNAEVGEIMGRTEGAIKSLYHRTLSSLREEIGRWPAEARWEEPGEDSKSR